MSKHDFIPRDDDSVAFTPMGLTSRAPRRRCSDSPARIHIGGGRGTGLLPELRQLWLVVDDAEEIDLSTLACEFPTVTVGNVGPSAAGDLVIDDVAWRGSFDLRPFDEGVENARPLRSIKVRGMDAVGVAVEVMARYQRLVGRRNGASATPLFDAVLDVHAALFDKVSPSARADFDHALDTWQWMLRLAPNIGLAPQIGALFHDIERLESPLYERLEHRARSGNDDAGRRGDAAIAILRGVGLADEELLRVRRLLGDSPADADGAILDDAETLSFLSLMSSKYADYFGLAQTRRKAAFMMARLGPVARNKLGLFRLRPDVARLLASG